MKNVLIAVLAVLIVSASAWLAAPLLADVSIPREKWTNVSMVSEEVNVALSEQRVEVSAVFQMHNQGAAETLTVGYPLGEMETALNDFKFFVDDKELANVKTVAQAALNAKDKFGDLLAEPSSPVKTPEKYRFAGPYKEWKVVEVPMAADEKKTFKVIYWVAPARVKTSEKADVLHYVYTLKTGAVWKGKIAEAIVRVKLQDIKPERILKTSPQASRADNGATLTWTFKDFKPTENVEVTFTPTTPAPVKKD